jgi:hypothetical protein
VDADGIRFFGAGHIIRGNYIHDIPVETTENKDPHPDCFQTWEDESHIHASDTIIEQNRCSNIQVRAQNTSDLGSGLQVQASHGLTVRNNLVAADVGMLLYSSTDISIFNNDFVGFLATNPDWYPSGAAIHDSSGVRLQNNIFFDQVDQAVFVTASSIQGDHNLAYRSDGVAVETTETYNHSGDLWDIDPIFVNAQAGDYHLRPGSPAIGAGVSLTTVTTDYAGSPRAAGKAFDIGAYSFTSP